MTVAPQLTAEIAIIGGSGLYQMAELQQPERLTLDTPYGQPSDAIVIGVRDTLDLRPQKTPVSLPLLLKRAAGREISGLSVYE